MPFHFHHIIKNAHSICKMNKLFSHRTYHMLGFGWLILSLWFIFYLILLFDYDYCKKEQVSGQVFAGNFFPFRFFYLQFKSVTGYREHDDGSTVNMKKLSTYMFRFFSFCILCKNCKPVFFQNIFNVTKMSIMLRCYMLRIVFPFSKYKYFFLFSCRHEYLNVNYTHFYSYVNLSCFL